ncbi:hypothetical protein MYE70_10660 [Marinobacter alexandrii]|uniref:hypothetical protein n=1 Tax=Marinobacter alexandrii TaxID=2570351 RepID=UPI001FFF0171|nr:hypothetical protein [Marinobacter alexandrii]MCK2149527.1 hypothetical protein [Marinobacter alexandrii]
MPSYKVENNSGRDKAVKVYGGLEVVKRGETKTLENATEMTEAQIESFASQGVKVSVEEKAKPASKRAAASKAKDDSKPETPKADQKE